MPLPSYAALSVASAILKNFASLTVARVLVRVFSALTVILAARYLGTKEYGIYAAAYSFVSLAVIFSDVGSGVIVLRGAARKTKDLALLFGNAFVLKLVLLVVVFAGTMGWSWLAGHSPLRFEATFLLGLGIFAISIHHLPLMVFQGLERMHLTAAFQFAAAFLTLGGAGLAVFLDQGLLGLASAQIAAGLLPLPIVLHQVFKIVRPQVSIPQIRHLISESWPFGSTGLLSLVMQQSPVLVLAAVLSTESAGLYAAAHRPVAMFWFIPHIVSSVVIPRLFRYAAEDPDAHLKMTRMLLKYLCLFGVTISGLVIIGAEQLMVILYGEEYRPAAVAARGLAWFLTLQCINFPLGDLLTTTDRHRLRLISMGAGAVVTAGGTWILGPIYGILGAAISVLLAEVVMLAIHIAQIRIARPQLGLIRPLYKQVFAALIAWGIAGYYLGQLYATDLSSTIIAQSIFLGSELVFLAIFRFWGPEDKAAFSGLFDKKAAVS